MYVIKRVPDGAYVAPSGSAGSYTRALQNARIFTTREAAERERCPGNEVIVSVESQLRAQSVSGKRFGGHTPKIETAYLANFLDANLEDIAEAMGYDVAAVAGDAAHAGRMLREYPDLLRACEAMRGALRDCQRFAPVDSQDKARAALALADEVLGK